jgi:hypothetical protein
MTRPQKPVRSILKKGWRQRVPTPTDVSAAMVQWKIDDVLTAGRKTKRTTARRKTKTPGKTTGKATPGKTPGKRRRRSTTTATASNPFREFMSAEMKRLRELHPDWKQTEVLSGAARNWTSAK